MLFRGFTLACPRCGRRGLFARWFALRPRCMHCGLRFDREEGYWLGATALNLIAAQAALVVVLVAGMLIFWPDVPWVALTLATVAAAAVTPLLFYPVSRTLWLALTSLFHEIDPDDTTTWHDA